MSEKNNISSLSQLKRKMKRIETNLKSLNKNVEEINSTSDNTADELDVIITSYE